MGERAADRWREAASKWLLPQSIIDAAPEPQATLDPEMFRYKPDLDATMPVRPSRRAALAALPEGGSVLDVGCGGGASTFGLRARPGSSRALTGSRTCCSSSRRRQSSSA